MNAECSVSSGGMSQVLRPASNLKNTDWFYKSSFSKINSFKSEITKYEIPSSEHQITNKSQISIFQ